MAKWYGDVGFAQTVETSPDVWEETIVSKKYSGDLVRNNRRLQSADKVNDDITLSNEISIVADPYARQNFHSIRYVSFLGSKWKVTSVDVQFPRLILSVGGLYNVGQN